MSPTASFAGTPTSADCGDETASKKGTLVNLALQLSKLYHSGMGKTGPKPKRADGYHVTRKGYLRGRFSGRLRLVHVVVWERANGPMPAGWQIHHANEDRQDNRLENLRAVSPT